MILFAHDGEAQGYEELTTTASIGFTLSTFGMRAYSGSGQGKLQMKAALITVETADIRFTLDGTTPTTTATTAIGHLLTNGNNLMIRGWMNIRNFKCINAVNASGATVKCTFLY